MIFQNIIFLRFAEKTGSVCPASVCSSVCLSICLNVCVCFSSVGLSVFWSVFLSVFFLLTVCLSSYQYVHPSVCLGAGLSVCHSPLSVYRSVCLFLSLSLSLSLSLTKNKIYILFVMNFITVKRYICDCRKDSCGMVDILEIFQSI